MRSPRLGQAEEHGKRHVGRLPARDQDQQPRCKRCTISVPFGFWLLMLEQFADRPARVCVTNNQVDITVKGTSSMALLDLFG